jgi:hypothetical protein
LSARTIHESPLLWGVGHCVVEIVLALVGEQLNPDSELRVDAARRARPHISFDGCS